MPYGRAGTGELDSNGEGDPGATEQQAQPAPLSFGLRFTGWAILLAAIGGLVFLGYRAYPAHQPSKKNPNFIAREGSY